MTLLLRSGRLQPRPLISIRRDQPLGERPGKIDRQKPVLEVGTEHLDALGEHEGLLELPRGNAAMQIGARRLFASGGRG